jgi:hypothetical protein
MKNFGFKMTKWEKINAYILRFRKEFILDKYTRNFIKHNYFIWRFQEAHEKKRGVILFEHNTAQSSIIAYSYLANILSRKFESKIVAYSILRSDRRSYLWLLLLRVIRTLRPPTDRKIFKSFGVTSFFLVNPNREQRDRGLKLFKKLYPLIQSKSELENLSVDGIWIGDLIYDTYLRERKLPTIDIRDEFFQGYLKDALSMFSFWQDYFVQHNVKAINVSHCVYNNAMPLRIAVRNGIPVYQINATHVYSMNEHNLFAYGDYKFFPDKFRLIEQAVQLNGIQKAKNRIDLRLAGRVGVDMQYSTRSAYGEKKSGQVLRSSEKFKVLIAAHCFFDSPHSYGNNLFPDFYEWVDYLGKISNETDYDWYIKTHPDFLPGNIDVINYFLCKYPRLALIDSATSHHQLIDEGIGCALTTYGTIGFEYAALGIPVINASLCNPHIAYDFNLHPKSIMEYRELLLNLENIQIEINKEKVYEYYFMKNIYNTENWLFEDYQDMITQLGGYQAQFSPSVYDYYLRHFNKVRHEQVLLSLARFVDSGDFRLGTDHMGESFH